MKLPGCFSDSLKAFNFICHDLHVDPSCTMGDLMDHYQREFLLQLGSFNINTQLFVYQLTLFHRQSFLFRHLSESRAKAQKNLGVVYSARRARKNACETCRHDPTAWWSDLWQGMRSRMETHLRMLLAKCSRLNSTLSVHIQATLDVPRDFTVNSKKTQRVPFLHNVHI